MKIKILLPTERIEKSDSQSLQVTSKFTAWAAKTCQLFLQVVAFIHGKKVLENVESFS